MRRGFTLIELLVVMAIFGVMMAIIVPSMQALPSTQVSMAAKDSLRLMRYARNMALQTQQPITLTFGAGTIEIASEQDKTLAETATTEVETTRVGTSAKEAQFAVDGGRIDEIGLKKKYDAVAFEFLGYNDTLSANATDKATDFRRRTISSTTLPDGKRLRSSAEEPFSVTVRANGTTRPFSIRVYEHENEEMEGDIVTFDFLCSGSINED